MNICVVGSGFVGLVIITKWNEFRALDLDQLHRLLRRPLIVDLRNTYDPAKMAAAEYDYVSLGRPSVKALERGTA